MTNTSSSPTRFFLRILRSRKALYISLFLLLCSVALLLSAKTNNKPRVEDLQWLTSVEAFDASHNGTVSDAGLIKKVVINASYEEVFHAASNSVPQAMWEIDKEDKSGGVLYAHRIVKESISSVYKFEDDRCTAPAWQWLCTPEKHLYFYRVKINELGAKQTEVVIEGKLQGFCDMRCNPLNLFGAKLGKNWCEDYRDKCNEMRTGTWVNVNDQTEVSQFVVMLHNNLIAIGGQ